MKNSVARPVKKNPRMPAQEMLRPSTRDWEDIFNAITDLITIHDKDYNIIYANTAARKNLTIPDRKDMQKKCFAYFHGTECPPKECPSCQTLKTGNPVNVELFEPHINKYIEIRAIPRFDRKNAVAGIIHIVRDITRRKESEKKLRDSRRQLRNLTSHLWNIREKERESVSREIHDELAQSLTAMHMDLELLDKNLPKNERYLSERTKSMRKILDETITTVHNICSNLRPKILDELGLLPALNWQARKFQTLTGINCRLSSHLEDLPPDQKRDINIFRIFQEILTNAARHAQTKDVSVSLEEQRGHLIMKVRDHGRGITRAQIADSRSLGIIGMRERVHFLQGEIKFSGSPTRGTTVLIAIPLHKSGRKGRPARHSDRLLQQIVPL